jgi:hypothetical protein
MTKSYYALGRLPKGVMNKLEAAYAQHLALQVRAGALLDYQFQPLRLVLAERTTYEPDFLVFNAANEVEFHEVKGRWEDDARVKVKVAAAKFPRFRFVAVTAQLKSQGGGWKFEEF